MGEITFVVKSASHSAAKIIEEARASMEPCNWKIGELAARWAKETERTDAEFGDEIGLTKKQVQQRRAIWDRFGGNSGSHLAEAREKLTWTHFRVALAWDDASESLIWATDAEATVQEMRSWRAAQHGDSLSGLACLDVPESMDDDDDIPVVAVKEKPPEPRAKPVEKASEKPPEPPTKSSAKAAGKPRETGTEQPRQIDPMTFDVMVEVERVRETTLELAAHFVAAKRLPEFKHALRTVLNDLERKEKGD